MTTEIIDTESVQQSSDSRLRLTEIFYSVQGEACTVGIPTIFIRLTGCPLRCHYCDTSYAFKGGQWWEISEILQHIKQYQCRYITVTGGEPLAQKNCLSLLSQLCETGYQVSLETSGALDISEVDARVSRVVDLKTPGSAEVDKNHYENINLLRAHDQVKFVLADMQDYEWAKKLVQAYALSNKCEVLFSPVHEQFPLQQLAEAILKDQLAVRLQVQLHKYIWGDVPGH